MRNSDPPPVIWARPVRGARGPAPAHHRDDIAAAAVRIADTDGIDAVSIRRVAAGIGVTPSALYRYVLSKDELFDLMIDATYAEQEPPVRSRGWRADLCALAAAARAAAVRHPWLPALAAGRPNLGPATLRWLDFAYGAFAGHELAADEVMANVDTLSAFVTGHVLGEIAEASSPGARDRFMAAQGDYGADIIGGGRFPHLARVMLEADLPHARDRLDRSFALGLDRILDGLAARLPASRDGDHGQEVAVEDP